MKRRRVCSNEHWAEAYWGTNYERLGAAKKKYDPEGLFFVHHGVGSEEWSADGLTRRQAAVTLHV